MHIMRLAIIYVRAGYLHAGNGCNGATLRQQECAVNYAHTLNYLNHLEMSSFY